MPARDRKKDKEKRKRDKKRRKPIAIAGTVR